MKKIAAIILAVLMLTGCQLASEEKREDPIQDRLVGVFVTFEQMDLEFDIEGWLCDNPGALGDGDITLDPAEGMEYAGRLPAVLEEDVLVVPGYEGLSILHIQEEDYTTMVTGEGVVELNRHIVAGDDGDSVEAEGTVYFPAGSQVMLCTNPVYMTEDGEYYVVQGQAFHSTIEEGGSMSQSVSDEKTWTIDGQETIYAAEFKVTVKGVIVAEKVALVWMGEGDKKLSRTEYAPGALPETITAEGDYLIVEQSAGETVSRSLYQPGDQTVTVYSKGEQPWCVPDAMQVNWPE